MEANTYKNLYQLITSEPWSMYDSLKCRQAHRQGGLPLFFLSLGLHIVTDDSDVIPPPQRQLKALKVTRGRREFERARMTHRYIFESKIYKNFLFCGNSDEITYFLLLIEMKQTL